MPWIISNGKSYVEIIGNNQMITTAYIDRAHTFNNKKTAEKYCSLLPKAMKNLKYKVIFISNPNPENPDLQLELLTPEFYLTRLKNFSDFIHTIQCQRETLVTGQRKAEIEIEDIEHAAEFYNLDASHGYQLYKLLHDARVRRRKCKNAIAWIDFILEQRPERFVENNPSARIVGTRSRDYAPRACLNSLSGRTKDRPISRSVNCRHQWTEALKYGILSARKHQFLQYLAVP